MRSVAVTTEHSAAMACPSRPSTRPREATEATQTDRSTDASGPTRMTMVGQDEDRCSDSQRDLRAGRRRLRAARMMTMWEPDTAVRCVSEVAFIASARSEGTRRSSPIDMPGTSPRASRGRPPHARPQGPVCFSPPGIQTHPGAKAVEFSSRESPPRRAAGQRRRYPGSPRS